MSDDDIIIYSNNHNDTRRNHNRFWLSKKGRDIGNSSDLDKVIKSWIWSNEGYGKRGLIVVDTVLGYTWGSYPGNESGLRQMKQELKGHKIWSTYEDGEDLHILVVGSVKDKGDNRYYPADQPKKARSPILGRKNGYGNSSRRR